MRVVVVASTALEITPLLGAFKLTLPKDPAPGLYELDAPFDALVTGVGQLQAGYHLGAALERRPYSTVLNVGIAGSFSDDYPKCSVVLVAEEELADLGAEDGPDRLDLFELKLLGRDAPPFSGGKLRASIPQLRSLADVPKVKSVTLNLALGSDDSIARIRARYNPDVVNMEGAAVFYASTLKGIPVVQLRGISDRVTRRDKSAWDIPGAVKAVTARADAVLRELVRE